ncbi:MAG: HIT family protein [Actinomycetota bacterium]
MVSYELDPATVVEDGGVWALAVNRNQNLLGKTMLVLRRPCSAVVDLDQAEWSLLQEEIVRVTSGLRSLFQPDQFNYAFLMNVDAQVHLHVVPRYAAPRTWRGREFTDANWGQAFGTDQVALPSEDLAALSADLRAVLTELV